MRLRLSTSHRNSSLRISKSLKRKRKDFENEIKQFVVNSLAENNNNKELVEKNVSLLAEVETLKKEKLDLFERFMFKQNPNQMVIKSDLIVLLESLKSDRKEMIELFETTNQFFNQMINKISDKIEEVIGYEDKRIECNQNVLSESGVGCGVKRPTSHEIYQMRQISRKSDQQNDCIQNNDLNLSIIPEATQEFSNQIANHSPYVSVVSRFETPIRKSGTNSMTDYELTPHFSNSNFRTPSIYNFDCNALRHEMYSQSEETSLLTLDKSLRPELSLSGIDSFNTTVTEEQNGMMSSTPMCQMRLSAMDINQRPSKRISSISRPFSPRLGRPSLIDIQNVMENNKNKSRKQSVLSTNCGTNEKIVTKERQSKETDCLNVNKNKRRKQSVLSTNCETNEKIVTKERQSKETNGLNVNKKRRLKCDSKSLDSNISETSDNISLSLRSSRRGHRQVSYIEPSLREKLRRPKD